MSSRKIVIADDAEKATRVHLMSESDLMTMSGISKHWPTPPHINFETADFGEDGQDFISQFYINVKRPGLTYDNIGNTIEHAAVREQRGQPLIADESPIDDEEPTTTSRLPTPLRLRRRELLPGEFGGPILLRKRHAYRRSLTADYDECKKTLDYEMAIHRGDLLPTWRSNEEAELMTLMWQKDRRLAVEARAFFCDDRRLVEMKQEMMKKSSCFFLQTFLGNIYLPGDLVHLSETGEYTLTQIPYDLRRFLIASVDKSEMAICEEILNEMDNQDGWTLPIRSHNQMEADERETVERMTKEFFGTCFLCHVVTITSGYKKCGCFIFCLVCAEIFKRGTSYVCPRCQVESDCLVTPYHG
uniref:RING-type domain-containing protein n=1 Tax=Plectus sambesii TaxID=2011161 RepID=A0A914WPK2_9BILA